MMVILFDVDCWENLEHKCSTSAQFKLRMSKL